MLHTFNVWCDLFFWWRLLPFGHKIFWLSEQITKEDKSKKCWMKNFVYHLTIICKQAFKTSKRFFIQKEPPEYWILLKLEKLIKSIIRNITCHFKDILIPNSYFSKSEFILSRKLWLIRVGVHCKKCFFGLQAACLGIH